MVHQGFPRRWRQPLILEQKPIIWQDFGRKLHRNKRNWTERGERIPSAEISAESRIFRGRGEGHQPIILAIFSRKLSEMENKIGPRGCLASLELLTGNDLNDMR